ncbi:MAG: type II secretion system F family protein, partial [Coriobacteriia bacterium]
MATTFKYSVRDKTGKVVSGRLEGESRDSVAAKLRQMGYIILDLNEDRLAALSKIQFGSPVKMKDITIFARQFATMINAGLSLTKCLSILSGQSESKELRDIISQVGRDVEAGQSLSEAMSRHPKVFPPIFINMVRAGETGGVLDEVLVRVADHFERDAQLKAKIKSAMTYPIAMGALVLIVLVAMMIFVVPTFQKMFSDMGGTLPLPTQILVAVSDGARSWPGLVVVAAVIASVVAFRSWIATTSGRFIWDGIKLR